MTTARRKNAELYPFPGDQDFRKFWKLNFYHLWKVKFG